MKLAEVVSHANFAFQTLVLRKRLPYMIGVVLTDKCNLNCAHCPGKNRGEIHSTFAQIETAMKAAFLRGNRYIYFTGGEPFCWEDAGYGLADAVALAKKIGFFDVFIATNGTHRLGIKDCLYYISVDGPPEVHNQIRCDSYSRIIENIADSVTPRNYVTFTVTNRNHMVLEEFARKIVEAENLKGILINFYTGDNRGSSTHGLTPEQKSKSIDAIIALKREGLPFETSRSALEAMRRNDWKRPIPALELFLNGTVYTCCRDVGCPEICRNCGYGECVEISQILRLKPDALRRVFRT